MSSTNTIRASVPAVAVGATGLVTFGTLAATMMQALDTTIANVALPHMQGSLSASQEQVAWVLTSYIVASAIATTPTGYLANRYGVKRIFLIAIVGFTVASMLCGVASSLGEIVFFRLLQGVFGAALVPLSQTTLLDSYPPEKQGAAMAAWGVGVMIGPILGPALGGWLTEYYSWRWVFYINLPIGIATFFALKSALPDPDVESLRAEPMDFSGFLFLSVAIAALQLMLDRGQSLDWFQSTEILIECGIAIAAFYLFITHTLTTDKPFIPPQLFRDRNLVGGLVLIAILGVVLFSTFALLPPFLQRLQGYPVITAGLVMMPRGVGTMIAMQISGYILNRVDARLPIFFGMLLLAIALSWMSTFNLDVGAQEVIYSGLVQGLGLGFIFVPLSAVTFSTLAPKYRGEGTSLFSLLRNVGSSVGIALAFAYQDYGTKMAHSVLVENINPFNPALIKYVDSFAGVNSVNAMVSIEVELQRQSAVIGMLGDFHYMAIGVLCAIPLILLLRPGKLDESGHESVMD
ncbi:DHA2 family efflux MFS transporter permease subunit [Zhongshania aquimaris]|uniref:DHA2 family efflux MFS transporter permease subunit n=1 Tax=Zhongshania aquimaris TaxID=2857107 RepID=A0ABS6VPU3_9GAMM|nr:DHA2 family efflux MFS transporter permease subunit [Zhongshania aquimaris]